jgi:FKBP-type peptidyl-prolyl cis-trans isomerase 2
MVTAQGGNPMIQNLRRRSPSSLDGLPGLPAEIVVDGYAPIRGTVVDVFDGRVVVDVNHVADAARVADAVTAKLTVHAPGVQVEAMTAASGTARGGEVELRIGPDVEVRRRLT